MIPKASWESFREDVLRELGDAHQDVIACLPIFSKVRTRLTASKAECEEAGTFEAAHAHFARLLLAHHYAQNSMGVIRRAVLFLRCVPVDIQEFCDTYFELFEVFGHEQPTML